MRSVRLLVIAGLVGLAAAVLVAGHTVAADEAKLTQQEIEKIVRDYLLREPEVLAEAFRRLQQRQSASAATGPSRPSTTTGRRSLRTRPRPSRATRRGRSPSSSSSITGASTAATSRPRSIRS